MALAYFDTIPVELRLHIIECLGIRDLMQASLVSKEWHALVNDPSVWRTVLQRDRPTEFKLTTFANIERGPLMYINAVKFWSLHKVLALSLPPHSEQLMSALNQPTELYGSYGFFEVAFEARYQNMTTTLMTQLVEAFNALLEPEFRHYVINVIDHVLDYSVGCLTYVEDEKLHVAVCHLLGDLCSFRVMRAHPVIKAALKIRVSRMMKELVRMSDRSVQTQVDEAEKHDKAQAEKDAAAAAAAADPKGAAPATADNADHHHHHHHHRHRQQNEEAPRERDDREGTLPVDTSFDVGSVSSYTSYSHPEANEEFELLPSIMAICEDLAKTFPVEAGQVFWPVVETNMLASVDGHSVRDKLNGVLIAASLANAMPEKIAPHAARIMEVFMAYLVHPNRMLSAGALRNIALIFPLLRSQEGFDRHFDVLCDVYFRLLMTPPDAQGNSVNAAENLESLFETFSVRGVYDEKTKEHASRGVYFEKDVIPRTPAILEKLLAAWNASLQRERELGERNLDEELLAESEIDEMEFRAGLMKAFGALAILIDTEFERFAPPLLPVLMERWTRLLGTNEDLEDVHFGEPPPADVVEMWRADYQQHAARDNMPVPFNADYMPGMLAMYHQHRNFGGDPGAGGVARLADGDADEVIDLEEGEDDDVEDELGEGDTDTEGEVDTAEPPRNAGGAAPAEGAAHEGDDGETDYSGDFDDGFGDGHFDVVFQVDAITAISSMATVLREGFAPWAPRVARVCAGLLDRCIMVAEAVNEDSMGKVADCGMRVVSLFAVLAKCKSTAEAMIRDNPHVLRMLFADVKLTRETVFLDTRHNVVGHLVRALPTMEPLFPHLTSYFDACRKDLAKLHTKLCTGDYIDDEAGFQNMFFAVSELAQKAGPAMRRYVLESAVADKPASVLDLLALVHHVEFHEWCRTIYFFTQVAVTICRLGFVCPEEVAAKLFEPVRPVYGDAAPIDLLPTVMRNMVYMAGEPMYVEAEIDFNGAVLGLERILGVATPTQGQIKMRGIVDAILMPWPAQPFGRTKPIKNPFGAVLGILRAKVGPAAWEALWLTVRDTPAECEQIRARVRELLGVKF